MSSANRPIRFDYDNLRSLTLHQLCNAHHASLKNVITSAPQHVRDTHVTIPCSVYKLLAIVLSIRENILLNFQNGDADAQVEDKEMMERVLSIPYEEVESLAVNRLKEIVTMVKASLRVNPSLHPRDFTEDDAVSVTSLVLKWQLMMTRAALERRDLQQMHDPRLAGAGDASRRGRKRKNPLSNSTDFDDNLKKQKVLKVAGVPTGENEDMQDFWWRLEGTAPIRPSQLSAYPGRTAVLLNVQELMDPSIVRSFLPKGPNIELVVKNIRWARQLDGRPFQSEVEAVTLARCLHFHLSRFATMEQAIVSAPWTEIALRRLWTLLEVQTLTSGPSPLTREEAWHQVLPSLEVYPDVGIRVPAMRNIVNRQVSAASRARNAVRSMTRKTQHTRQQKKSPRTTQKE